jgi:hypothetical protein
MHCFEPNASHFLIAIFRAKDGSKNKHRGEPGIEVSEDDQLTFRI